MQDAGDSESKRTAFKLNTSVTRVSRATQLEVHQPLRPIRGLDLTSRLGLKLEVLPCLLVVYVNPLLIIYPTIPA